MISREQTDPPEHRTKPSERSKRRLIIAVPIAFSAVLLVAVARIAVRMGQAERSPQTILESSDPTLLLRSADPNERAAAQLALFYQARSLTPEQIDTVLAAACDQPSANQDEAMMLATILAKTERAHTRARVERLKSEISAGRRPENSYLPLVLKAYEER